MAQSTIAGVPEIIQALNLQLSPTASQNDRLSSLDFLNSVMSSENAPQIGLALASTSTADGLAHETHVRFFGLQCLERTVRYYWAERADRAAVRDGLVHLALHGLTPDAEPLMIKAKLAAILVEVAKREWPTPWDLSRLLAEMFGRSVVHREIVFLTLSALCQDINDIDFADEIVHLRKRELLTALSSIVLPNDLYASQQAKKLTPFVNAVREVIYVPSEQGSIGWFIATTRQLEPLCAAPAPDAASARLAVLSLRTLASMVMWIPASLLQTANLLAGLAQLLSVPGHSVPVQFAAAEVLFLVCHRDYGKDTGLQRQLFQPFIDDGHVDLVVRAIYMLDRTHEEAFDVMKLLVQAIVDVGVRQLAHKVSVVSAVWIPDRFPQFIASILELQQHPSVTLSTSIQSFWLTLLKHAQLKTCAPVINAIPMVLEKAVLTFERRPSDANSEFSNARIRDRALSTLWSHTRSMLRLVAQMATAPTAQWIMGQLASGAHLDGTLAMIDCVSADLASASDQFLSIYRHLLKRTQAAAAAAVTAAAAAGGGSDSANNSTLAVKEALFLALLRATTACVGAVPNDLSLLLPLMQIILNHQPHEKSSRYQQLGQLAKIASAAPDLVYALDTQIRAAATTLPLPEVCHVIECQLVAILHTTAFPNPAARSAAVRALFDPILLGFCSDVDRALPLPTSLPSICIYSDPGAREMRSRVMLPMVTLNAAMKRAAASSLPDAFDVYIPEVTRRVMTVIQCAHAVTDKEWGKRDELVKMMQDVPLHIKASYLKTSSVSQQKQQQTASDKAKLKVQMWVEQLKSNSYTLLGHLLRPTFYAIPGVSKQVIEQVFSHLETLENRHLAALLRCAVEPLVANCPPALRPSLLTDIVPPLSAFVIARLDREWAAMGPLGDMDAAGGMGANDGEEDDDEGDDGDEATSVEVLHDRQLRSMTVTVVDMIAAWFSGHRHRRSKAAGGSNSQATAAASSATETNTSGEPTLAAFVVAHVEILEPVLALATAPTMWGEPAAVAKGMQAVKSLLPALQESGVLAPGGAAAILAGYLIPRAVCALRAPVHVDVHDSVISMIAHALDPLLTGGDLLRNEACQALVDVGAAHASVVNFATAWPSHANETDRERAVKALLMPITGVAVGETGKVSKSMAVNMVNKVLLAPSHVLEEEDPELGDLFDETNVLDHAF
ncbi:armadillo-type protein [Blastocladiella britannica]|nr:armadillo-type protein [Blastocladiella britannica]